MEERIKERIRELEQSEKVLELQLRATRTVLAELRALLAPETPDAPKLSGDPLGEQQP